MVSVSADDNAIEEDGKGCDDGENMGESERDSELESWPGDGVRRRTRSVSRRARSVGEGGSRGLETVV